MNNDSGRIYYGTGLDNSQLRTDAAQARNILQGIGTSAAKEGDRIDTAMKKIGASIAGVFAIQKMKEFAVQVATVRGQFQQLEAAFKVLTGDAAVAENLMSQLIHTAATTPFGVTDISNAARQLLAYGVEADKVNETLIRLGDICAGLSIPIGDLAYLYGTTMTQGRLYTADLNQFLGRGIPLADELAKQFGVAKEEIKKMVEDGKVGFPEVQQAIINLTNEGGKFGGLMEEQSKTITGRISNIEDTIEQMFNQIGQSSEGVIGMTLDGITAVVENWEGIGKVLLTVIAAYGSYKAAVIAVAAAHKLMNIWGTVQAVLSLAKSVTSAKDAMLLFNMAVKANPLGLILGILGTAATAFALFSDNTGAAAEMTNKYGDSAAKTIGRVETLTTTLKGLTAGTSTHTKVMEELNGILEDYGLQAIKEGDSIDTVNAKREQAIELIKQEGVERQRANALEQGYENYSNQLSAAAKTLQEDLANAMTGTNLGIVNWLSGNDELQQNAAAISTIIGNVVEENISLIAGKTGDEYQKGLDKIFATIQDRMRAVGISEETIQKEWFTDGLFNHQNIVQNYINTLQNAKEEYDRYSVTVNKASDAERAAADGALTFSQKVEAIEKGLQKPTEGVHDLYENIKRLMSQYSNNTIGFTIRIGGEVPKWMKSMDIPELQRLAKRFTALGQSSKTGAYVNGKYFTRQQLLQRGADYATAAEQKQTEKDEAAKAAKDAAKEAERTKKQRQAAAKRLANERQQIADETAERNRQIAEYSQSVQEAQAQAELDIRQSQIEGMEESYEKQKAQIKLNYDRLIAENKKREQDMTNALTDAKVLEWQNKHPKATRSETIAYRASLNLTVSDLTKEQQDQLEAYQKLAEESMVRGNKEALNTMLQDCLTYEQQRAQVVEEYQKKIEALYEHDENGARVKDTNGNDKFKDGVTQGNVDELNYQQEKAVNAIDEQFAQREETYKAWCSYITDKTIDDLKLMLEQAKAALAEMEKSDPSNPQLATARAKVNTLESEIDKKQAKKDVSPDKRSIKEWEDLYKTLNECDKQFEEIGKTIGGVAGEIIQTAGEITSSALSMINGIMQLVQGTTDGIQGAGEAASTAIQTVEKASVILTIVTAAMQIATKIVSLFNNDDKKQEEIEKLQDRIDQLQWELDHADVIQLQNNTFDTLEKLKELTAEATDEIVNMYNAAGKFNSSFYNKIVLLRHQSEIAEKTAEKLAKAYANVSYTANKFIGNGNTQYDQANDQLKNYAQQIVLIQEQIDKERSKKDTDNGKIQEWEQKIQELGNEMVEVINGMVEDIMGGSSSDIAQELSDAFFEAFQNGEDYAEAWGDKVDEIISDILKRMLVQKWLEEPLGDIFNKYKDKWFKDGEFLGLDTVINSLPGLSTDLNNALGNFSAVIEALPEELKNLLNITDEVTREASEKGIAQASQDSVDELNGRATAIQGHTYSISENTKLLVANSNRILESVLNIEVNTNGLSTKIETVESHVKEMRDTINDIAIKGIKIK